MKDIRNTLHHEILEYLRSRGELPTRIYLGHEQWVELVTRNEKDSGRSWGYDQPPKFESIPIHRVAEEDHVYVC